MAKKKLQEQKSKLEKQFKYQELNEQGNTGYLYGSQEPIISKKKGCRTVTVNAYTLITHIKQAIENSDEHYITISLGDDKELSLDLITLEALYINDRTGEESYLDSITFSETED